MVEATLSNSILHHDIITPTAMQHRHSPGGDVGLVGSLRRRLRVHVGVRPRAPVAVVVLVPLVAAVHGTSEPRFNRTKLPLNL